MGRIEIIPRRNRMDKWHEAENAIYSAIQVVEQAGADENLTEAVIKLNEAQKLVADFIDKKRREVTESRLKEFKEALVELDLNTQLSVEEYRLRKAAIESTISELQYELLILES